MHHDQGLPPRAGSEYEGDLHPYGVDRYAPTDPRAFAARLDEMRADTFEQLGDLKADMVADLDAKMDARFAKMEAMLERLLGPTPAPPPATPTATPSPQQRSIALAKQRFDERATREAARAATSTPPPSRAASYLSAATATPSPQQQFPVEQELRLAEDHIAFGAASRIQDDEDEARENELLCVQAGHSLAAQERPCAQEKDNAQYLEQENDGRRIQ